MPVIAALLAGLVLGGGLVGFWLSSRWKAQIKDAEQSFKEIVEQHKEEQEAGKALRQKVADLEYQLTEANKTVRYLESRFENKSQ
ncbi:MAG: hypothetical protein ACPGYX_03655 [Oceanobacter sp.]